MSEREVLVVGGGIAGLSAATALVARGVDVELIEAADEVGGHFRSDREDGYTFAHGPQAIPGFAARALDLVERLGLGPRLVAARGGSRRFVWREGRPVRLPSGPVSFLTSPFLSARGKLRLASEPWRARPDAPDPEESVAAFFRRRIGAEATEALVGPFVTGIHAGDPERLETRSAFPRLARWEADSGSLVRGALRSRRGAHGPRRRGLFSFPEGLGEVVAACADRLEGRVRTACPARAVERCERGLRVHADAGAFTAGHVILATPPPETARLLRGLDEEAAKLAGGVPMAPVAVVHLGGPLEAHERAPEGFGLLVPRSSGFRTLGIVYSSSLFPGRAPAGAWLQATYLGGVLDPDVLDEPDDTVRRLVGDETEQLLGFSPDRGTARVIRHPAAIPQLVPGHAARVDELRRRLGALPRLALAGNWLDGVGLEHAVASGEAAASRLAA